MELINGKNKYAFKEKTKYEKGFSKFYAENLYPLIEEFNKERIIALKKASKNLLLFIVISFVLYKTLYSFRMWLILLCFLLGIHFLYFLYALSPIFNYESRVKEKIYKKIFEFLGSFKYICEYSILANTNLSFIQNLGLYGNFDNHQVSDVISGSYKEHKIIIFNAFLESRSSNPMDYISTSRISHWTLFNGLMIHFAMNKPFLGKTLIFKKGMFDFYSRERNICKKHCLKKVEIKDSKFAGIFNTYSSDKNEVEYLLSDNLRKGLLSISTLFKKPNVEIFFFNNSLLISIHNYKNKFDPGFILFKNTFINDSRKIIHQMGLIFDLIDTLR